MKKRTVPANEPDCSYLTNIFDNLFPDSDSEYFIDPRGEILFKIFYLIGFSKSILPITYNRRHSLIV